MAALAKFAVGKLPFFLMFVGERIAFPALSEVKLHPAFGLVILVNFVGSSVYLVVQGAKVGQAREKFKVELPEMYATERGPDGKLTEDAYKFNCVQRAHQQAFETYPQFLALSAVSGLQFPLSTAAMGLLWIVARKAWADGYSTGVPINRYKASPLGPHVWTPLIVLMLAAIGTGVELLAKAAR